MYYNISFLKFQVVFEIFCKNLREITNRLDKLNKMCYNINLNRIKINEIARNCDSGKYKPR